MLSEHLQKSAERLDALLQFSAKKDMLSLPIQKMHELILRSFVERGKPPNRDELGEIIGDKNNVDAAIHRLAENDLIVLDKASREIVGAYPMTIEDTSHHMLINGIRVNAMCALDALAVSPMYGFPVEITSKCTVTAVDILVKQVGERVIEAHPSTAIRFGMQWKSPGSCAAHSLCRSMVFLRDGEVAHHWQEEPNTDRDVYTIQDAVELASHLFKPLARGALPR